MERVDAKIYILILICAIFSCEATFHSQLSQDRFVYTLLYGVSNKKIAAII